MKDYDVMEEEHVSALSEETGKTVFSTDTDLRDDYYNRLVEDYLGVQSGKKLHIEERPCKNRLLVQVGLLKEDNQVSWISIVKWLQKIFPMYKSSDFRTLIERSMATASSLNGDARQKFLESNVNFEFVGPICDLLGIGRSDLLQMSDFSEKVKCMEITNGLVLELNSFVKREKIDPVVLVSWLRNFNQDFCSDGRIHKAYTVLQKKIHKLKLEYRGYQKQRRKSALLDIFLQNEFNLVPASFRCNARRLSNENQDKKEHVVSKMWKSKGAVTKLHGRESGAMTANRRQSEEKSNQRNEDNTELSMEFEEGTGAKEKVSKYLPVDVVHPNRTLNVTGVKQEHDSLSIQYTQVNRELVKGTIVSPSAMKTEVLTLLDLAILFLEKLSCLYSSKSCEAEQVSRDLLQKHVTLMLAENPVLRQFNDKINEFQDSPCPVAPLLHFLDCNARFLKNVNVAIEQHVIAFEKKIIMASGEKLGRDKNPKFANFVNFSESTATRYIRMVCDVLSPPAETKYSCRRQWIHFCQTKSKQSRLAVSRSNRVLNYYECAASVIHHHGDIMAFFSDLESNLGEASNVVLDSVKDDADDQFVQALVCVLAIVYCKILGPYWQLLKSSEEYVSFRRYAQCLHQKLVEWSGNASRLLLPESSENNIFHQFPLQEKNFDGVFLYCGPSPEKLLCTLITTCLEKIVRTVADVMENTLKDFLEDGIYSKDPSLEQCLALRTLKLSHLMCEYPYGHGCSFVGKRSGGVAVPSTDRLESQETVVQKSVLAGAVAPVAMKSGGLCTNQQGVDCILMETGGTNHSQKQEAVHCDRNNQKTVLSNRDENLNISFPMTDVTKLKTVLPGRGGNVNGVFDQPNGNVKQK